MLSSDILRTIASDIVKHIGNEWKHEVDIFGVSEKHINCLIDHEEYMLVLHKVKENQHWTDYLENIDKGGIDDSKV